MLNIEIAINVSSAGSVMLTWLTLSQESARATAAGLHDNLQATAAIGSELSVSEALRMGESVRLTCFQTHAQATATGLSSVEVKVDSGLMQTKNVGEVLQVSRLGTVYEEDAEVVLVACGHHGHRNHRHSRVFREDIRSGSGELLIAAHFWLPTHIFFQAITPGIRGNRKPSFCCCDDAYGCVSAFMPPRAAEAAFDCGERTPCLNGTRTDILKLIDTWIELGHIGDHTANSEIFWVNGAAGTGKTTISRTVAQACKDRGILGASFFCSRDSAECSNPKLLFTTTAYQLSLMCGAFGDKVAAAMTIDPDMGLKSLSHQLEKLILEPLDYARESLPSPCVIIIDALDECGDDSETHAVLACLSKQVSRLTGLRVLITSRPEQNITSAFSSRELGARIRLNLHEVGLATVTQDITHFLTESLTVSGVSARDIEALSEGSGGLFIFAATSVRFIMDRKIYSPRAQRIASILKSGSGGCQSMSPHSQLDKLYMQVLVHAFPNCDSQTAGWFQKVVGAIVLLRDPLAARDLQALLNPDDGDPELVERMLGNLHALILVPEDVTQSIRLLHPSFHDFLTDADRCKTSELVITVHEQHTNLAVACLHALNTLKQDMCCIRDNSLLNHEVKNIDTMMATGLPSWLRYACCHWGSHLAAGEVSDIVIDLLNEFCSEHLLHWLEACSLLGVLRDALLCLDMVQRAIAVCVLF